MKIANNDLLTTTDDGFDLNAVTTLHPCYALEQERLVSPEATFVANEIHVSPNPGSGISKLVIVPNSDGYLRTDILDLNGRIVKSLIDKYATREERIETEFSVMDLPNGVYLIRTTTENSSSVEKFIVAR